MSLRELLKQLSTDAELMDRFRKDPGGTMTDLGVSAEDQEIMSSRDEEKLAAAIGQEHAKDEGYTFARFF